MDLNNAKIIDVRSPMEFQGGHVKGAKNIPIEQFAQHLNELKTIDTTIVLCCASGGRSSMAYQFLQQHGLTNIHDAGPWQNAELVMSNFSY